MENKRYNIFTAIALIIGTVIGSGIFFKSDNILFYTNGNVGLGVVVFCFASIAIVFGCLTLSELARRTDKTGGVISYAGDFYGKKFASAFGWFFSIIYYPTLSVVVSWVVGIYVCMLFNIQSTLETQIGIGFAFLILCVLYNIFIPRFAGYFQQGSTIIKLIPLFILAFAGLFAGNPQPLQMPQATEAIKPLGWIAAIGPVAFAFDGWVTATSISSELKNAKRSLPLALIISPLFILLAYLAYFVGVSRLMGPANILALGDEHVNLAANQILGSFGAKFLLVCIIISVMGTVNGVVMAGIRAPYALALDKLIPFSKKLGTLDEHQMPVNSGKLFMGLCFIWYLVHFCTMKYSILPNSDISEISIVVQYLIYIILYLKVMHLRKMGQVRGIFRGVIFPLLASLGSIIILIGGLQNPLAPFYALFCILILWVGYYYGKKSPVVDTKK